MHEDELESLEDEPQKQKYLEKLRVRLVRSATYRHGLGRDAGDEVAQRVLLVVAKKRLYQEHPMELIKVAYGILRKKILEYRREESKQRTREVAIEDRLPGLWDPALEEHRDEQLLQLLEAAMPQLDERCRRLLRYDLQELPAEELMRRLDIKTKNNLWVSRHRCHQRLKRIIERGEKRR